MSTVVALVIECTAHRVSLFRFDPEKLPVELGGVDTNTGMWVRPEKDGKPQVYKLGELSRYEAAEQEGRPYLLGALDFAVEGTSQRAGALLCEISCGRGWLGIS